MIMKQPLVAVTDAGTPAVSCARRELERAGARTIIYPDDLTDPVAGVGTLVAGSVTKLGPELLELLPDLRLVVRTGAGYEHVDVQSLSTLGVRVAHARALNVDSVAEFVFAGLLALMRRVREADTAVRTGDFAFRDVVEAHQLRGRTLGVLGYGGIGRRVAEIGRHGFNMPVLVHHPWSQKRLDFGAELVSDLDEFFERSDIVSIHCRLSEQTASLVGRGELVALGGSGYLVNTARGPIVDSVALAAALRSGAIAGAVLDVFDEEPPPLGDPMLQATNVVVSPHLAGHTIEGVASNGRWAATTALAYAMDHHAPPDWSIVATREDCP